MGEKFIGVSHLYFAPADGSEPLQEVKLSEPARIDVEPSPLDDAPAWNEPHELEFTIKADRKTIHKLFPKQRIPRIQKKGVMQVIRGFKRNTKGFRALRSACARACYTTDPIYRYIFKKLKK